MGLTKYPNGISSMGMPILGTGGYSTTGSIYFVDSNTGSNGNSGEDKDHPFADIDYAIGQCTASKGDIIFVMPGHSETAASQITCDVAGVSIIGLGRGGNRPLITAKASAVDCINVTAHDVYLENLHLYYAASCTAFINLNDADDFCCRNCWFEGGATPLLHVTVADASRFHFDGCRFESETDGADSAIKIEATDQNGWIVENCVFNAHDVGWDLGVIHCSYKSSGGLVKNCQFIGVDTVAVDINSSNQANGEGLIADCHIALGAGVAPSAAIDAGGMCLSQVFATDSPSKSGGHVPPTSDS